jgi:hypothetical protein
MCNVALSHVLRRIIDLKIKSNSHGLHNVVLRDPFEWWIGKGVAGTGGGLPDMLRKIWRKNDIPSGKQHFFSEFKTGAPNVRLKTCRKSMCYGVQHQVYVRSLTNTVKLLRNKVTAERHIYTSSPKNKAQILTSWPPCLLRYTKMSIRRQGYI